MSLPIHLHRPLPGVALAQKILKGEGVVAGVLSGTSADGIDVVLFRPTPLPNGRMDWLTYGFETLPFEPSLAAEVRWILDGGAVDVQRLALLHRDLGIAFGLAARQVGDRCGYSIDLVGSHGQTVWHHDGNLVGGAASLQLGDGDFIAEASGATVVSDFRQRDMAAGGEGAPIGHLVDPWLFPKLPLPGAILNLGGFGNLTLLNRNGGCASFDTGPAGALLDGLTRLCLGESMDLDGVHASQGRAHGELFAKWMGDVEPFLRLPIPRSTGRDSFGATWVRSLVEGASDHSAEDLLATGVLVVAECVARSLVHAPSEMRPLELIVAGGGARNPVLLRAISERTGLPVTSSSAHGIDPDAREALIFGLLAVANVLGIALPFEGAEGRTPTGARSGRILGKTSPAPPVEVLP
jgi:anhydro-N-acetylmuramic acid kinase